MDDYQVRSAFCQRVKAVLSATMTSSGGATGGFLKCYAIVPPDTETQKLVSCSIRCRELPELRQEDVLDKRDSSRKYKLIQFRLQTDPAVSGALHFDITYEMDLFRLSTVKSSSGAVPVAPLSEGEEKSSLESSPTIDFENLNFQSYLDRNNLRRGSKESNLEFAYRAYQLINKELAARTVPNRPIGTENLKASKVCQPTAKDDGCGVCSILFTATMRANKVPSRLLVGRLAKDSDGSGYGQWHVRSDFFDPKLGWDVVDQTFGLIQTRLLGGNPNLDFGNNNGDYITFHKNSDLVIEGAIPKSQAPYLSIAMHQFQITAYDGDNWPSYQPRFDVETWRVTRTR